MTPLPSITVVTPSFNQGAYIDATIRSVLDQNYPALQYLVMDGGSTDQTLDILRKYESRLSWISQKDAGQADAIRKGFAAATGDILCWLNSDDTLEPDALRLAADALLKQPQVGVVYGDCNFITADDRFIARCAHVEPFDAHRLLHYSDFIVQPAAFFRRNAYEAVGGVDPSLHYAMDYDLWLKLAQRGAFSYIPRVLANYRWLGENKSAIGGQERLDEVKRVAIRHGARGLPAYFQLESVLFNAAGAVTAIRRGKMRQGVISMMRSLDSAMRPRAMRSLLRAQTWRIIRTGQLLRRSAKA